MNQGNIYIREEVNFPQEKITLIRDKYNVDVKLVSKEVFLREVSRIEEEVSQDVRGATFSCGADDAMFIFENFNKDVLAEIFFNKNLVKLFIKKGLFYKSIIDGRVIDYFSKFEDFICGDGGAADDAVFSAEKNNIYLCCRYIDTVAKVPNFSGTFYFCKMPF